MRDHNKIAVKTTYLCHKHFKVLGILIAKSATTSTVDLFRDKYGFKRMKDTDYDYDKLKNLWSFTFVRNPWDRLVSTWASKVENTLEHCFKKHPEYKMEMGMSFDAFIKSIDRISEPPEWWDAHIRPQWYSTCNWRGDVILDYIGRMENYDEDLRHIQKHMTLEPIRPKTLNKTKRNDYRTYYNSITARIVAKIYERDIDLFKYSY